jgi:hypothetical protein
MRAHLKRCLRFIPAFLLALACKIYYMPLHSFHRLHCHTERLGRVDGVRCRLMHHEEALGFTRWNVSGPKHLLLTSCIFCYASVLAFSTLRAMSRTDHTDKSYIVTTASMRGMCSEYGSKGCSTIPSWARASCSSPLESEDAPMHRIVQRPETHREQKVISCQL